MKIQLKKISLIAGLALLPVTTLPDVMMDSVYAKQITGKSEAFQENKKETQEQNDKLPEENNQIQEAVAQPVTDLHSAPMTYLDTNVRQEILNQLVARTGVDAGTWNMIITRESTWNPTVYNPQGYYGLFQLAPGYFGNGGDIQTQVDNAVVLFQNGGMSHWAATAY